MQTTSSYHQGLCVQNSTEFNIYVFSEVENRTETAIQNQKTLILQSSPKQHVANLMLDGRTLTKITKEQSSDLTYSKKFLEFLVKIQKNLRKVEKSTAFSHFQILRATKAIQILMGKNEERPE